MNNFLFHPTTPQNPLLKITGRPVIVSLSNDRWVERKYWKEIKIYPAQHPQIIVM
ncbi:MAG: hypothetical protein Q8M15_01945 [Bacteroidota bacterium]|nr:hypothetical protein [Bacteroidota bacterium]